MYLFADEIGKNQEVLQHMTRVPIVIRVLVTESQETTNEGIFKVLRVQEEIIEVDNKVVKQIKVTQLVMKLDSANNELIAKREITAIELKDSEIHNTPKEKDTHKYPDGRKKSSVFSIHLLCMLYGAMINLNWLFLVYSIPQTFSKYCKTLCKSRSFSLKF